MVKEQPSDYCQFLIIISPRHILSLIGIAFQVKLQQNFRKSAQAKEEPALLEKDCENSGGALDSNHDSLTNSLL